MAVAGRGRTPVAGYVDVVAEVAVSLVPTGSPPIHPPAPVTTVGGGLERVGHHVTRAAMVVRAIADHIRSGGDGNKLDWGVYRLASQQGQTVSFPHSRRAARSIRLAPAVAEGRVAFDLLERWIEGPELVADALDGRAHVAQ